MLSSSGPSAFEPMSPSISRSAGGDVQCVRFVSYWALNEDRRAQRIADVVGGCIEVTGLLRHDSLSEFATGVRPSREHVDAISVTTHTKGGRTTINRYLISRVVIPHEDLIELVFCEPLRILFDCGGVDCWFLFDASGCGGSGEAEPLESFLGADGEGLFLEVSAVLPTSFTAADCFSSGDVPEHAAREAVINKMGIKLSLFMIPTLTLVAVSVAERCR